MADALSPSIPQRGPLYNKVALKVLRLSRPSVQPPRLLVGPDESPVSFQEHPPATLSLPQAFANPYVGETFRCVLSLDSESDDAETPITATLSVTISTPNREHPISLVHPSQPDSTTVLGPRENKQYLVEFETYDPGIHVVTAIVTYKETPAGREPSPETSFTKTYRFTADQGLYVRTKISTISPESCALEAQIENITTSTMTLESAEFIAPNGWTSQRLVFDEDSAQQDGDSTATSSTPSLMPKETWQFAYIVSHDPDHNSSVDGVRQSVGMGKFSVAWRREPLGEKGWLMTGHLKRNQEMQ